MRAVSISRYICMNLTITLRLNRYLKILRLIWIIALIHKTAKLKLRINWNTNDLRSQCCQTPESWEQDQSHQSSYLMLQHYYRAGRGPVTSASVVQCTRSWSCPELIWAMLTFPSTHPNTHSLVTILTIVLPYTPSHTPMFWPLHLLGCCISNILCQLCVRS